MANQRTRSATESIAFLVTVGGILVAINVLGAFGSVRVDTTEKELYSLSNSSKRLAGSLEEELEITAYFTEDPPPPGNAVERYVRDILSEYAAHSSGKINIKYIYPDTDAEKDAARSDGIQEQVDYEFKEDRRAEVKVFRGLVMRYLDRQEVVNFGRSNSGLEYTLTTKLKKLIGNTTRIAIVKGHEGPTLQEGLRSLQSCLPTYSIQEVDLSSGDVPSDLKSLLIVGPNTPFTDQELQRVNKFVMEGGNLGIFGGNNVVKFDQQTGMVGEKSDLNLNKLIAPWGASFQDGLITDANCGRVNAFTPHPPMPNATFSAAQAEHPTLFRLNSVVVPFPSAITVGTASPGTEIITLATSSENSVLNTESPLNLNPRRNPNEFFPAGSARGPHTMMVAIEGKIPSAFPNNQSSGGPPPIEAPAQTENGRVFITGSAFVIRDELINPNPQQPIQGEQCARISNFAMALNVVDWLAQDSDLMAVRAKLVEDPPIDRPANLTAAEDEIEAAAAAIGEANKETLEAAINRDQNKANEAQEKAAAAQTAIQSAEAKRKAAVEEWESTKNMYRLANMLGIPAAFALFGLVRWRMRQNRRRNLSL